LTYYTTVFSTTTSVMTYIDVAFSTTTSSTTYPSPTFRVIQQTSQPATTVEVTMPTLSVSVANQTTVTSPVTTINVTAPTLSVSVANQASTPYLVIPLASYFSDLLYALVIVLIAFRGKMLYKRVAQSFRRHF
jgi:hypothetical protein